MSRTLQCVLPMGAVGALLLGAPAWSAPWSRGYVVDRFEPGFLFGGPTVRTADGLKRATGEPGTDCPNGISRASRRAKLTVPWRDPATIEAYANAPPDGGGDPKVTPAGFFALLAQRGYREGINTSFSVFAAPDPGIQEVGSDVADGFDLDGDPSTGGFRSPSGQPGVDNAWYRAVGCIISWRGGAEGPSLNSGLTDQNRKDGIWANTVIRISGSQDPMNDTDATVEIAWSPDSAVSDAARNISEGYSFRMAHGARYTKLKATIVNGLIQTEVTPELRTSAPVDLEAAAVELVLHRGRMRLEHTPSGGLRGMLGGYVKWTDLYMAEHLSFATSTKEALTDIDPVGEYYALRRNADAMPDETGRNTALSTSFYISATPAFVIEPATPIIAERHLFPDRLGPRKLFLTVMATMSLLKFELRDTLGGGGP